jgi:hypothetical protein
VDEPRTLYAGLTLYTRVRSFNNLPHTRNTSHIGLLDELAKVFGQKEAFDSIVAKIEQAFTDTARWQTDSDKMIQEIVYAIKPNLSSNLDVERNSYGQTMAKVRS